MFEFLFKYPPAVFSRGKFVLLGSWPLWVLAGLIIAGTALLFWRIYRSATPLVKSPVGRRRALAIWLLESVFLTLVLFLLWQPAISVAALKPQQNVVAVIVDDSRSMSDEDPRTRRSRREAAARILDGGLLRRLQDRFQVRLYRLGSKLSRIERTEELKGAEPATHISPALNELASEAGSLPIGSVVLLSDGADNSGGIALSTMEALRSRYLPVNTIGFGREQLDRDVELDDLNIPLRTLTHSRVEAQVSIRQNGFTGKKAKLVVKNGSVLLGVREITLRDNRQTEIIEFNAGPEGPKTITAALEPIAGETNQQNNRAVRVLQVDGGTRRVLYVEGEPRWDYKFLRRAVEDDQALHVVSMLRTTQNKLYRQGVKNSTELAEGFPTKAEDLFAYDAIILGSVESGFFTPLQQEMIKQFVDRRGGGLLFLGGRTALGDGGYNREPFNELLPVKLPSKNPTFHREMAEAVLTDAGRQSLICRIDDDRQKSLEHWKQLPYLPNYQEIGAPKPGAVVLAQMNAAGTKLPLLVTENYGRGRTAVFATGGSWRWQMQQPLDDMSHEYYWRQLMRWLVAETPSPVDGVPSTTILTDDGDVRVSADVRQRTYLPAVGATVTASIVGPDGSTQIVPLKPEQLKEGIYSTEFRAPKPGLYTAEITGQLGDEPLGRKLVSFAREDGMAENFHREQNRELLEKLAAETGGRYFPSQNANQLVDEISYSEAGITAHETKDLWDMPIVFFAAMALRAAEWLMRRKWGYV